VKALTGQEMCRLLEAHGWVLLRITGSHHIYGKRGTPVRLSVPVHGNRTLKSGLQQHLLRLSGIGSGQPH